MQWQMAPDVCLSYPEDIRNGVDREEEKAGPIQTARWLLPWRNDQCCSIIQLSKIFMQISQFLKAGNSFKILNIIWTK